MVYPDVTGSSGYKTFSKLINIDSTSSNFYSYLDGYALLIGLVLF
jgi:hypothetical protein